MIDKKDITGKKVALIKKETKKETDKYADLNVAQIINLKRHEKADG